ncbi:DUF6998 domain-containing protein [Photobacterium leiognathi]|uniref:DUF6998 domain-containing protein n=1 Tax=Photobacterium leiognathi TaxID=553611 RepID=UPI0027329257|nr:hypothetical protein [Photobacterium leiognathi]
MKDSEKLAIKDFFEIVTKLKQLNVIRSDKYLGDIAEFITAYFYNIELSESGREPGHDGINEDGKVQIKYHGSITRTNINLGNPDMYETLLVVLGPNSLLRSNEYKDDFLLYRFTSEDVRRHKNQKSQTYSCGKSAFSCKPDKVMSLNVQ